MNDNKRVDVDTYTNTSVDFLHVHRAGLSYQQNLKANCNHFTRCKSSKWTLQQMKHTQYYKKINK